MNVLDLFSGIGGFSLGLERAGMRTVAFCEIEPFCRRVLAKHWPGVPVYDDVRSLTADRLRADGIAPDVICGGFPCQDISLAGKGAGIDGESSGLWSEYARIIGDVRPRYVIVENSSALTERGLGRVLGDLAALGYNAEWHCLQAADLGAPHIRDRMWIVSNASSERRQPAAIKPLFARRSAFEFYHRWPVEPDVGRVAYGLPQQLDRCRALGNAVVPQIPEIIGRAILAHEAHA